MASSGASNTTSIPSTTSKPVVNSRDIAYEYCTLPNPNNKNITCCNFCKKVMGSGVTRLKQHLLHISGNVTGCSEVPPSVVARLRKAHDDAEAKKREAARIKSIMNDEDPLPEEGCDVQNFEGGDDGMDGNADADANPTPTPTPTLTPTSTATPTPSSGVATLASNKKRKFVSASNVRGPMDTFAKKTSITVQTTLDANNPVKKKLKEDAWECYAKWSYSAGLPFNAVNDPNFPKFIHAVGDYGRAMPPPTYHSVRVTMMKKVLKQTKDFVESFRPKWKEYGCSIMSDFWTDQKGRCLVNFLVNCPQGTVFLKSIDASKYIKDKHLIVDMINEVIEDVGKENIVQFITDNASNYKAAGDILMETHETIYWTPCAAHCINLMLQDIGKINIIQDVLGKAKKVVVYIYNHGRVLNMMRKLSRRELHRSCVTRFATSFYTLESMFKNRHHVQTLFVSAEWTRSAFAKTSQGKAVQVIVSRGSFWKNMQVACQTLAPLVDVIRMVDREEQPCMGYIYEAMERAKSQIEKNLAGEASLSSKVLEIIDRRWTDQMEHPLHSAGYYLNPSIFYKQVRTEIHMRNVKRRLYRCVERMIKNVAEADKIRIQLEEYEVAAGDFGSPAAIRLRDNPNVSPSKWWNMHGLNTPELQNFAMRVLNQTCSASPCERNWSAFDNLHTKKRNCLLQDTLNKLVYIQYNMKLERRFKDLKRAPKTFDPIVLREVEENDDWVIPTDEELEHVFEGDDLTWDVARTAMGGDDHVGPSTRSMGGGDGADDVDGDDSESEYEEMEPGDE